MRPRKAANGLLIIVSLLALIAFVGCDLAGYDITEDADVLSRGKPAASTKAPKDEPIPPVIYSGAEGEVIPVDSTDQYETRWEEGDPRYRLLADTNDDGIVEAWEVVTENATHALVGEKFIGYYSSTFSLWAGQDNFAGDVTISNGLDGVTLSVDTTGSADIAEYHIYTYTSEGDLPDKRPAPGQAPYVVEGLDADSFEIFFSFEELGGTVDTTYYFIIHAALADDAEGGSETSLAGETAYVAGEDLPDYNGKGAWFYVVSYSAVPYFEPIIVELDNSGDGDDDVVNLDKETAYAGNTAGDGSSWWYYIDASADDFDEGTQFAIYAGQKIVPGAYVMYAKEAGILSITFGENMSLQGVDEPIKINGYEEIPDRRPNSGNFPYKFESYNEEGLYVDTWDYLIVHFDAEVTGLEE
jgi:hypothetical protein